MSRVAVTGASGKMGRSLVRALAGHRSLQLAAAVERPGSGDIGKDPGQVAGIGDTGIVIADDLASVTGRFDILIDFTIASATAENIEICASAGKKMVIGTTGLDVPAQQRLVELSRSMAIVQASNFSVGVNVTFRLLEVAAAMLGDSVDIEILEVHHRHKVDAPSGTALTMAEILAGHHSGRMPEIHSMRTGDIVGEHTVVLAGAGERIEIVHRAHSRENFAEGALRAAMWLEEVDSGLHDMRDVLGQGTS